ncbi:MAG: hypothetical protein IJ717_05880 [Treponema sp.]|nr:hypothetical protein [Treponema sp.]
MKFRKLIINAAVLAVGSALGAQEIHIGGYVDYSSTLATQVVNKEPGADEWDATQVGAEFGPVQNGIHFLNLDATALNVDFHTNVWIGSGLGPWYADVPQYIDRSVYNGSNAFDASADDASSPIGQMWVCTHFVDDQLRFYTGNFASNGWNAGYVFGGYVLGGQKIEGLAGRALGSDSAFTGVEVLPRALNGFKAIVGFPVAPFVDSYEKFNDWSHFIKSVKFMTQYRWLLYNVTFNAGVRPNSYMTNGDGYKFSGDYTESLFGEAFLQVDMPSLIYGVQMNASYDFRWRDVEESGSVLKSGKDWSDTAFAHILQASARFANLVEGWTFGVEDRFAYYQPHYIAINETAIYNVLAVSGEHPIAGTSYAFGFNTQFMYGQDASGKANGYNKGDISDYFDAYCSDLIAFDANFMGLDGETAPSSGSAGRYFSVYGYPYVQKNFANGYTRLGVELQYKHLETSNVLESFSWRVPLTLTFWW